MTKTLKEHNKTIFYLKGKFKLYEQEHDVVKIND
jgi:hypothetical protein